MTIKDFFVKQLAYSDAMNITQLNKLKELEHPPHETVEQLSHLVKAQLLWLDRLYGKETLRKSFLETWPLSVIEEKIQESHNGWIALLNEYEEKDLNREIDYKSIKGETFCNTLYDIIFHVINHSTHHRAMISKLLRQHDVAPPVMDYIAYAREN